MVCLVSANTFSPLLPDEIQLIQGRLFWKACWDITGSWSPFLLFSPLPLPLPLPLTLPASVCFILFLTFWDYSVYFSTLGLLFQICYKLQEYQGHRVLFSLVPLSLSPSPLQLCLEPWGLCGHLTYSFSVASLRSQQNKDDCLNGHLKRQHWGKCFLYLMNEKQAPDALDIWSQGCKESAKWGDASQFRKPCSWKTALLPYRAVIGRVRCVLVCAFLPGKGSCLKGLVFLLTLSHSPNICYLDSSFKEISDNNNGKYFATGSR